jgi:hypothetical protein
MVSRKQLTGHAVGDIFVLTKLIGDLYKVLFWYNCISEISGIHEKRLRAAMSMQSIAL